MYWVPPRMRADDQPPTLADAFASLSREIELMANWLRRASKYEKQEEKLKLVEDMTEMTFVDSDEVAVVNRKVTGAVKVVFCRVSDMSRVVFLMRIILNMSFPPTLGSRQGNQFMHVVSKRMYAARCT